AAELVDFLIGGCGIHGGHAFAGIWALRNSFPGHRKSMAPFMVFINRDVRIRRRLAAKRLLVHFRQIDLVIFAEALGEGVAAVTKVAGLQLAAVDVLLLYLPFASNRLGQVGQLRALLPALVPFLD